jgi:hypothetical protein
MQVLQLCNEYLKCFGSRNASIIVKANSQCVLKTLYANIGVNIRWDWFHDANILVGTNFQCMLG